MGFLSQKLLRDGQLHLLQIARREYMEEEEISLHVHEDVYQLVIIHNGSGEMQMDGETLPIVCGHYYLIPPHIQHGFMFAEAATAVDYQFRLYDEELKSILSIYPAFGEIEHGDLADLLTWFHLLQEYHEEPQPLTLYRMDSGFKGTLLALLQKGQMNTDRKRNRLRSQTERYPNFPIAAFIHNHVSAKLTLVDIAKHFGFHPHYIIKICNDRMGKSPMQYLQDIRLEKAMDYLETTDWTVTEISEKLGWTTSYFSRLFHQKKGISPSLYRKKALSPVGFSHNISRASAQLDKKCALRQL